MEIVPETKNRVPFLIDLMTIGGGKGKKKRFVRQKKSYFSVFSLVPIASLRKIREVGRGGGGEKKKRCIAGGLNGFARTKRFPVPL